MPLKSKIDLKLDWATHDSARYACEHWHYSKCMPAGKTVKIGVWEDCVFIGVVIYSYGANNNAAKSFNLTQYQCCELTRVALNQHSSPVSRILRISLILLKKICPDLKLIFSYSDLSDQKHHGGIYQANGWDYLGLRKTADKGAYYLINGKQIHGRSARAKYGNESNFPKGWKHISSKSKYLYVKVLDKNYKLNYNVISEYPKRVISRDSASVKDHFTESCANQTITLQQNQRTTL